MKSFIDTRKKRIKTEKGESMLPDLGGYETDSDINYSVMDRGDGTCLVRVTYPASKKEGILKTDAVSKFSDSEAEKDIISNYPAASSENLDVPDIELTHELNNFPVEELLDEEELHRAYIIQNWKRTLSKSQRHKILSQYNAADIKGLFLITDQSDRRSIISQYNIDTIPVDLDTGIIVRSIIQNSTHGRQALQDQELTAINKLGKAKQLKRSDELTKNTRAHMEGKMGDKCKKILEGRNNEHKEMLDYVMERNNQEAPWVDDINPPAKGKF